MTDEPTFGPLRGLRVADFSIMAAGPWTAALLGQLGAEVIKVEAPSGDGTRWVQPLQGGMGTNYISMNINKKDITLDLKSEDGLADALKLVESSDILVQNFRVGALEKLGLGVDAVRKHNPRLIYCSISGFGSYGPLAEERCADFVIQAASGFSRLNGPIGSDGESFRFTGFLDLTTGIVAVEAILAALLERQESGIGQHIDVSMLEAALEMQHTRFAEALVAGQFGRPMGSETPSFAPDRAFKTLDMDIFVSVRGDQEWRPFCAAIEAPDLAAEPSFVTNRLRVENRGLLNRILEPVFVEKPAIWWERALTRQGVAVGLAQHIDIFRHHGQVIENEMIVDLDTEWGRVMVGGVPWRFSATPCRVTPPPVPDADTKAVLGVLR